MQLDHVRSRVDIIERPQWSCYVRRSRVGRRMRRGGHRGGVSVVVG